MKKFIIILISIILILSLGVLIWYGAKRARGVPVIVEKPERIVLEIPFIEKEIDLSGGVFLEFQDKIPSKKIPLMYQVTVLPWPKSLVSSIIIKAFHNKEDIYFYISWEDSTEDRMIDIDKFSDACAIMFPLTDAPQPETIMMGFLGKVNVWQWKGNQDTEYWEKSKIKSDAYSDYYYPFEKKEVLSVSKSVARSAVNDLISARVGTVTQKETQLISGRGFFDKNRWHVVFKRSLNAPNPDFDAKFAIGGKRLCAFAVWDGSRGDRGGRKSISDWVELEIK